MKITVEQSVSPSANKLCHCVVNSDSTNRNFCKPLCGCGSIWFVPSLQETLPKERLTNQCCVFLRWGYNSGTDLALISRPSQVAQVGCCYRDRCDVVRSSESNGTRNRLDEREIPRINIINVTSPSVSPRPLDATFSLPGGLRVSGFPGRATRDDGGIAGSGHSTTVIY